MDRQSNSCDAPLCLNSYNRRPGTGNLGKEYEIRLTALVALRCIAMEDTKDMWLSSNMDDIGDFDDIVIYRQTSKSGNFLYMMQLKHQENPQPITKKDLENVKGNFSLKKYSKTFALFKTKLESTVNEEQGILRYLREVDKIMFIFYTNKTVLDSCNAFKQCCNKNITFLDTSPSGGNLFQFVESDCDFSEDIILFANQIHANDIENLIETEIKVLFGLSAITNVVVDKYVEFIKHWMDGCKVHDSKIYFTLTKSDIIGKLSDILLGPYKYNFSPELVLKSNDKQIWREIIQDKYITIVDCNVNDSINRFLNEYVGYEVGKYFRGEEMWKDKLTNATLKLIHEKDEDLERNLFKMSKHITALDVYTSAWFVTKIPMCLKVTTLNDFENIVKIVKLSCLPVIITKDCTLTLDIASAPNCFANLSNLSNDERCKILYKPIKLQNRPDHQLGCLIDEAAYQLVMCKDVIEILEGSFNVGNKYNDLNTLYIKRKLSRVLLSVKVFDIKNEMFALKLSRLCTLDARNFSDNVIIVEESQRIEDLQCGGKVVHEVVMYNDVLEWKKSVGSTENILQYILHQDEWINFEELVNILASGSHIISSPPGMGKSTFAEFMAISAPTKLWVIKVVLKDFEDYYENTTNNSAIEHLNYFAEQLLRNCANTELSKRIFQKCLDAKQILIIFDGYDEIVHESQVLNVAKSLHSAGFSLCITTRPNKKCELESILHTVALELNPFTSADQELFFSKYFSQMYKPEKLALETFHNFIEKFLRKLLKVIGNNFPTTFMQVPLHAQLLAEYFSDDCKKSLREDKIILQESVNLVDLFRKLIKRKNDILCEKFGKYAKTLRNFVMQHEKLFALKCLHYDQRLEHLKINEQLSEYYCGEGFKVHLLQQEGILVAEQNSSGDKLQYDIGFTHRMFAEFLAAEWFVENFTDTHFMLQRTVKNLVFYRHDNLVYDMFNLILANECPLHVAILTGNLNAAREILQAHPSSAVELDKAHRTVLHIIAIKSDCRLPFAGSAKRIIKELPSNIKDTADLVCQCTALDYAVYVSSYTVANEISEKFPNFTITYTVTDKYKIFNMCAQNCYKQLFKIALKFYIATDLLLNRMDKSKRIDSYCTFREDQTILNDYVAEFGVTTVSELFQLKNDNLHYYYDFNIACALGTASNVKYLLSEGAELSTSSHKLPPLHYAAYHKRLDIVKLLLQNGARPDEPSVREETALHFAATSEIVHELLASGADIEKQNAEGDTPLNVSLQLAYFDCAITLLENGADVHVENNSGNSSIHNAVLHECNIDVIPKLLATGVSVNKQNKNGSAPLHMGVHNVALRIVEFLLNKGANVNLQNCRGKSALHVAVINPFDYPINAVLKNRISVVRLLLDNGAEINLQDEEGNTPLHYACCNTVLPGIFTQEQADAFIEFHREVEILLRDRNAAMDIKNTFGMNALEWANFPTGKL